MFENNFKRIDAVLRKDAGCGTEIDYVEQTSWILFLKYLDSIEANKKLAAELSGKEYTPILKEEFRWHAWAAPLTTDEKLDHAKCMSGEDLIEFVEGKLFPYLKKFKELADNTTTIEYKIGEIFSELRNRIQKGTNLRAVINIIEELRFQTEEERHEMSVLYETKIQRMGNAGRNGGEYYTPRPLIRTIIEVIKPKIGETIYDPALGSAGFLCEAFSYLKQQAKSTSDNEKLQKATLFGKEKKIVPYIIGNMNMILHGVEAPNVLHTNTLEENINQISEKDKKDIIIANPPFGGDEDSTVLHNFNIQTSETAYLFLQHFIKSLKAGGRAGIIIKNTFLSNGDAADLRKELCETCNLYAILDLPQKVFTAGVKTVVLFFKKGTPTKKIWYYQLNLNRNLGKTNPLNETDLADFLECIKTFKETENSWTLDTKTLDKTSFDLSVKNPNKNDEVVLRTPEEILKEIEQLDSENAKILRKIKECL
jgi:type I restriction-modification system, M subunit